MKTITKTELAVIKVAHSWHHWFCEVSAAQGKKRSEIATEKLIRAIWDDKRAKEQVFPKAGRGG